MSYFAIFLTYIFINNFILVQFMGLCPFIGVSKNSESALGMGLAVTFVTSVTSVVCWCVYYWILVPLNLEYLETVIFILLIAAIVQVVELFIKKASPSLYKALGIYLPLITTNCIVLGIALINITSGYDILGTFIAGLSAGLGFTLAIVLMSNIREKQSLHKVPKYLEGAPLTFISAGLMSMAFMAFDKTILINLGLV